MHNDSNAPSPPLGKTLASPKRSASAAGLHVNANRRPVKRRASKACQCCRHRKVRCNVVEQGVPCTNCKLDEVECIVTESKRRKKHHLGTSKPPDQANESLNAQRHVHVPVHLSHTDACANGIVNPIDITNASFKRSSHSHSSRSPHGESDKEDLQHHVPHALYQSQSQKLREVEKMRRTSFISHTPSSDYLLNKLATHASVTGDLRATRLHSPAAPRYRTSGTLLPPYLKPLPKRMTSDDISYLYKKGALTTPDISFRNELLRSYIEHVHPYMPLLDLHEFLRIIDQGDGINGKASLIVFQAVMFAGAAFVDMVHLSNAGYSTRKAARKSFYQKARLLYDFDYECDRLALVQSLLLMTYWYETPDDQKDTWHWMGVAISLAHTIGLHRNTDKSDMEPRVKKLWKRIWWSCFMRDRLVALGMRRPTRIKDGDYDVPMLEISDFEIQLFIQNQTILPDCTLMHNLDMQRDLAGMCVAKAKLCLCISHVLTAQYSVLIRDQSSGISQVGQESNTRSRVMLYPKKMDHPDEVRACDKQLNDWYRELPSAYQYSEPTSKDIEDGKTTIIVQKALLHMIYLATVSALHRPQVLPSLETSTFQQCRDQQDISRETVRDASQKITEIACSLHALDLERYLPTTGVTVLLPAIIIHLLDMKSQSSATRDSALQGFCSCMVVLEKLRDNYAAADYATHFLEAALRKADIDINLGAISQRGTNARDLGNEEASRCRAAVGQSADAVLLDTQRAARLTPPLDSNERDIGKPNRPYRDPNPLLHPSATTPPASESSNHADAVAEPHLQSGITSQTGGFAAVQQLGNARPAPGQSAVVQFTDSEFEALINFDEFLDPAALVPSGGEIEAGETHKLDLGLLDTDAWMLSGQGGAGWGEAFDGVGASVDNIDNSTGGLSGPAAQMRTVFGFHIDGAEGIAIA